MEKQGKKEKKDNPIDDIKLEYLRIKLAEEKIKKPTREDVERILKVSYPQAYNYLKALKKQKE